MQSLKKKGLSFKFSLMFTGITVITLIITFMFSFFTQSHIYSKQREQSIQYLADYLEKLITLDDDDFLVFQDYFIEHHKEYHIPKDFALDEINESRELFETLFAQQYPGMVFGNDITFDEVSKEVKDAYAVWNYEYYRWTFEEAAKSFNVAYAYYLVPTGEPEHMYWFLDIARDPVEEGSPDLYLCIDVLDPVAQHKCMWEAWNTGKRPSGYDIYDDSYEYGMTYAYYTPLFINSQKLGVIGVEVEIKKFNNEILSSTIYQMIIIAAVLLIFMILFLITIRVDNLKKLIIQEPEENPSDSKIEKSAIAAEEPLSDALELFDSLTGIRNKQSFSKEVQKIEWEISSGCTKIGIAIASLDFDVAAYGNDNKNKAIISLCDIICNIFAHSPVFRTEDNKFAVILKKHDLSNIETLVLKFNNAIDELKQDTVLEDWEKLSAEIHYAVYYEKNDKRFENLLKRADK